MWGRLSSLPSCNCVDRKARATFPIIKLDSTRIFPMVMGMKPCRECNHEVSEQAAACPECGAPRPAIADWNGWGFEYKSQTTLLGLPLIHISFKYSPNRKPVPAKGIIAIGQFGVGVITIAQFGVGLIGICQFTVAGYALAQFALAWSLIAQIGIYVSSGIGQTVFKLSEIF